ncbi:MAG TPA: hypothetical protein VHB21_27905 [Minicystis sp.]|nr:hypothetical protein [Minicystis sp.]
MLAAPELRRSFRRRRALLAATTVAVPLVLAALLWIDRAATGWLPAEQPARGRAILLAFFSAIGVAGVVQAAAWRCPSCGRFFSRGAFWTKRCASCDAVFG